MTTSERVVSKTFEVSTRTTSPMLAEAFGLDMGFLNVVIPPLRLPSPLPQITYITGESGAGKSTLLSLYGGPSPIDVPASPLWAWGNTEEETLAVLSACGLGDAVLFSATYATLSDSQKMRATVAWLLLSDVEELRIDEFLSTLDRRTACAVAFCIQKAIRRTKKRLIAASAHDDIVSYLQPDIVVAGEAFPSRWSVTATKDYSYPFTIAIEQQDKFWYRHSRLAELHYRGKYTGGPKEYFSAMIDGREVGLLVSKYRPGSKDGRRIARLVTHPSYRGIGVGVALVRHYLSLFPDTDTVASMARFVPVFEKAGMRRVKDTIQTPPTDIRVRLLEFGFDESLWWSKQYCLAIAEDNALRQCLAPIFVAKGVGYRIAPGGKKSLPDSDTQALIIRHAPTCGRLIYEARPKHMARFVGPGL